VGWYSVYESFKLSEYVYSGWFTDFFACCYRVVVEDACFVLEGSIFCQVSHAIEVCGVRVEKLFLLRFLYKKTV